MTTSYRAMTIGNLAEYLAASTDDGRRWRLIAEFLAEYRDEPTVSRHELLAEEPGSTSSERWDVFLAAGIPPGTPRRAASGCGSKWNSARKTGTGLRRDADFSRSRDRRSSPAAMPDTPPPAPFLPRLRYSGGMPSGAWSR